MTLARALFISLFSTTLALAADPFVGTWKHNLDKSKLGKQPTGNFAILKWEAAGKDHYRVTRFKPDGKSVTGADGKPLPDTDFIADGKERQITDYTRVFTRIDATHLKSIEKGNGGAEIEEFSVSADGKTLTMARKGTATHSGRPLDEIWIYDKQ